MAIAAVLVASVVAAGTWVATRPATVAEVRVFDPPRSFCASQRAQSFSTSVSGIAAAHGGDQVRSQLAHAKAEVFRRTAARDQAASATGGALRSLADELERDAHRGDFTAATRAAAALDQRARRVCR